MYTKQLWGAYIVQWCFPPTHISLHAHIFSLPPHPLIPSSPHPLIPHPLIPTHIHTLSPGTPPPYIHVWMHSPPPPPPSLTHTHTDWHGHPKTRVHHSLSLGLSHQRLHCSRFLCHICHATAVSLWTQHPSCICPIWGCFNTTSELAGRQSAGGEGK